VTKVFIQADMQRKRESAMRRVKAAIEAHGGTTLLSTGITGDDARMARAAVAAGARMLEPNHPAVALRSGLHGVQSMHEAEQVRHEVTITQMADVVSGVRAAVGPEIVITVGIPGAFTELQPVLVRDEDLQRMALAGADGLHTHKSGLVDLAEWVESAHRFGLFVDAYVGHPDDRHAFGIPAETPDDVGRAVVAMKECAVDIIGLMTGFSYEGVAAGQIPPQVRDRLSALVAAAGETPTAAEGGITPANCAALRETGVNVLVVGTTFDDIAAQGVREAVSTFLPGHHDGH
jgi:hypothetical protein